MRRTSNQISYNMSQVRSRGSRIEKAMAALLRRSGMKYRSQCHLFGRPDFRLVGTKVLIFCDSSFWHGYRHMTTKRHLFKSNRVFWKEKILRNIERDSKVNKVLENQGYRILRFWDFEIVKNGEKCVQVIRKTIDQSL
jgi:DNA mismatch endonuclease, patch repair protein